MSAPCRREWGLVGLTWLIGALVTHRSSWTNGFDQLTGDNGDARLIALLHEHWLDVASGDRSWLTPAFFHPAKGTLGYSDTFVLDLLFYAPLRLLGCDRFMALQGTIVLLGLLGFVGCYTVCTRLIGAGPWMALGVSWVFAFANSQSVQAGHPQLLAVAWVPWWVLLTAAAAHRRGPGGGAVLAGASGVLLGLIVYSTYYIGWFTILGAAALAPWAIVRARRDFSVSLARLARHVGARLAAFAAGFAVPMVPFALTYLPSLEENGGRDLDRVLSNAPGVADIVNVGRDNLVWGRPLSWVFDDPDRLRRIESANALTPLLTAGVLMCAVLLFTRWRRDRSLVAGFARALAVLSLVFTVLPLRIVGSFTLWRIVYSVVPGASGLRAIDRIELANTLVASLAIAATWAAFIARPHDPGRARRARRVAVALVALFAIEQVNTRDIANVDHSDQVALLAAVPAPPAECGSFFILPDPNRDPVVSVVDAMLIAQDHGLPTLNGYSGGRPQKWTLLVTAPDYLRRIQRWQRLNGLEDICSYDATTHEWDAAPFRSP